MEYRSIRLRNISTLLTTMPNYERNFAQEIIKAFVQIMNGPWSKRVYIHKILSFVVNVTQNVV